jgi:hypothetical protein
MAFPFQLRLNQDDPAAVDPAALPPGQPPAPTGPPVATDPAAAQDPDSAPPVDPKSALYDELARRYGALSDDQVVQGAMNRDRMRAAMEHMVQGMSNTALSVAGMPQQQEWHSPSETDALTARRQAIAQHLGLIREAQQTELQAQAGRIAAQKAGMETEKGGIELQALKESRDPGSPASAMARQYIQSVQDVLRKNGADNLPAIPANATAYDLKGLIDEYQKLVGSEGNLAFRQTELGHWAYDKNAEFNKATSVGPGFTPKSGPGGALPPKDVMDALTAAQTEVPELQARVNEVKESYQNFVHVPLTHPMDKLQALHQFEEAQARLRASFMSQAKVRMNPRGAEFAESMLPKILPQEYLPGHEADVSNRFQRIVDQARGEALATASPYFDIDPNVALRPGAPAAPATEKLGVAPVPPAKPGAPAKPGTRWMLNKEGTRWGLVPEEKVKAARDAGYRE